jgi:phosphoribosylaminoimidazolecarboxamide formyltransferase/IMP cyclohydrolase
MPSTATRRALVSVSNKTDLLEFVAGLVKMGFEILSTGGTRRFLLEQGVPVVDVTTYTGFPEIMEGRVKTLHPKVHGGLLGRLDHHDDLAAMKAHGILPFELVVCNLYPFESTIARPDCTHELAIENIDIGGPSMVRSAAKNHAHVLVVTHPGQYQRVLADLEAGAVSAETRRELAAAAFEMTATYDRAIANYLAAEAAAPADARLFPERLALALTRKASLRYGENPHQQAAFYVEPVAPRASLAAATQLHGKELSYNNLLDLDAALALVREFNEPAAAVIKHNNPCGAGTAPTIAAALDRAWSADPVSAFGSILAFNRPVDLATAEFLCAPDRFVEAIIAPAFERQAFEALTTRPRWKANVRLMECAGVNEACPAALEYRGVLGGMLLQERDDRPDPEAEWKVVTRRIPTDGELSDLRFAWRVARHVKSNAIVFARSGGVVGVGAGQMSRVDAAMLAVQKAGNRADGAVAASDAFFPFRDGVDICAKAGIRAIVQPGGSRNDADSINACDEQGMAMIFTGRRHFRH